MQPLPPPGYADWTQTHFPNPNSPEAQPEADPDGDGLANLMEYALGTVPHSADRGETSAALPAKVHLPGGEIVIEFTQQDLLPPDVSWALEQSASPAGPWAPIALRDPGSSWQILPNAPEYTLTPTAQGDFTRFRFNRASGTAPPLRTFYRLTASLIP